MFDLKKFKSPRMDKYTCEKFLNFPFGFTGGKAMRNSWKIVEVQGKEVFILGKPKKLNCFSIVILSNGNLDVAYYFERAPKEIADAIADKSVGDAEYIQIEMDEGWALPLIKAADKGVCCLRRYLETGEIS